MRVAAVDQGTTSTRCLVVDEQQVLMVAAKKHARFHPHAGWVEQDAEELLRNIQQQLTHGIFMFAQTGDA